MHVEAEAMALHLQVLQCSPGTFPQTYLGLPLSNVKLPLAAFAPLIARVDKYLASWKALLLTTAGRVVLINAVLGGLVTYAMGAMMLPPGVVKVIDARRRAFLWTGTDAASGAKCLVAWDTVCKDKEDGGLGIKRLATQNACLLLKLLHHLHHPQGSAWASWARQQIHLDDLSGPLQGTHWEALRELLPAYRAISKVSMGDGRHTSFWHDTWLEDKPLAVAMPAVFSHYLGHASSVHDVLRQNLRQSFQPRFTVAAAIDFSTLSAALQGFALGDQSDTRSCFFEGPDHRLLSGLIYKASVKEDHACPSFKFIWASFAPPRVKFFSWLLVKDRIHCRVNLKAKNILDQDLCELCHLEPESVDHLLLGCSFVQSFWAAIGWNPALIAPASTFWQSQPPLLLPTQGLHPLLLLFAWEIWKHRNDVIFNANPPSIPRLRAAIHASLLDWSCRIPAKNATLVALWSSFVSMY